jgi:hypothetical protein
LRVVAGDAVAVRCVVRADSVHLADVGTAFSVVPQAEQTAGTFVPTEARVHVVKCRTADGTVADDRGIRVDVAPAQVARIDTILDPEIAEAGEPVRVQCAAYDAFGNVAAVPTAATRLSVAEALIVQPPNSEVHVLRGTTAGDYEVACQLGGVTDPDPAWLTVVPGIPAQSETSLEPEAIFPGEWSRATCLVRDDYGNEIDEVDTTLYVLPEDGDTAAMEVWGSEITSTRAGTYHVSCAVRGYLAADESPAALTVHPGLPHHWTVDLLEEDCYWQGRPLPLVIAVYDAWGNAIPAGDFTLSVSGARYFGADVLVIDGEGDHALRIEIVSALDPDGDIEPYLAWLRVDSTPPSLVMTSPARGSMLLTGYPWTHTITVAGIVSDGISEVVLAQVAGVALEDGSRRIEFSLPFQSRNGISILEGRAEDACGNARLFSQAVFRGWQYYAAATSPQEESRVSESVVAYLGQDAIDEAERDDIDDLATIAETVLAAGGIDAGLPDVLTVKGDGPDADREIDTVCYDCVFWTECNKRTGYKVVKNGAFHSDPPAVEFITTRSGGLKMKAVLEHLFLPLWVFGNVNLYCAGEASAATFANIYASRFTAYADLDVSQSGGAPVVSICPDCVSVYDEGLWVDAEWGVFDFADALLDELINAIISAFKVPMRAAIAAEIREQVPGAIARFLSNFRIAPELTLPAPIDLDLSINSGISSVSFTPQAGRLGLWSQIYPPTRSWRISSSSRGSIRGLPSAPVFDAAAGDFGVAIQDDTLNQLLWATWYGGGLYLDHGKIAELVGDAADLSGLDLAVEFKLPPVLMQGTPAGTIDVGLGDVRVDATVDLVEVFGGEPSADAAVDIGVYFSSVASAALAVDPASNELQVVLDGDPEFSVQVIHVSDAGYQAPLTELMRRIVLLLLPKLLDEAIGAFPIPKFELGAIHDSLAGSELQLLFPELTRTANGYTVLMGELGPPPPAGLTLLTGWDWLDGVATVP